MKLLFVASYNKSRFAPFIVEQAEALRRAGCEVDFFGVQGGIGLANSATLSVSSSIVEGNSGDQIGAYGNAHSNGTRAQVKRSYVEGGAKACNIPMFIVRPDNFKTKPKQKDTCGCKESVLCHSQISDVM